MGLQRVTRVFKGLQGSAKSNRGLKDVKGGYMELQELTEGSKVLKGVTVG